MGFSKYLLLFIKFVLSVMSRIEPVYRVEPFLARWYVYPIQYVNEPTGYYDRCPVNSLTPIHGSFSTHNHFFPETVGLLSGLRVSVCCFSRKGPYYLFFRAPSIVSVYSMRICIDTGDVALNLMSGFDLVSDLEVDIFNIVSHVLESIYKA